MTLAHGRAPEVHRLSVPVAPFFKSVNALLIKGDGLALVDTGPKGARSLSALRAGLAQLGYGMADIDQLVITHPHVDHFGLARPIVAESGARVYAHPRGWRRLTDWENEQRRAAEQAAAFLQGAGATDEMWALHRLRSSWLQQTAESLPADSPAAFLEDDQELILAGVPWRVLYTPGHCDAHVCLYEPRSATLIAGDLLLPDFHFIPVASPPQEESGPRSHAVADFLGSLERIQCLEIRALLPGHGQPTSSAHELIERERRTCHAERRQIQSALAAGPQTACQVWSVVHAAGLRGSLDPLTEIELVGCHLGALQGEGQVTCFEVGGLVHYRDSRHNPTDRATASIH